MVLLLKNKKNYKNLYIKFGKRQRSGGVQIKGVWVYSRGHAQIQAQNGPIARIFTARAAFTARGARIAGGAMGFAGPRAISAACFPAKYHVARHAARLCADQKTRL